MEEVHLYLVGIRPLRGDGDEGEFHEIHYFKILLTRDWQDFTRVREIYRAALKLVPHKRFTFTKVWTQFAMFEVRQLDLDAARKILGTAIGMAPKEGVRPAPPPLHPTGTDKSDDCSCSRSTLTSSSLCENSTAVECCTKSGSRCVSLPLSLSCVLTRWWFAQHDPSNASAWIKWTELEGLLSDVDRVRAIYELAINQPSMDMPELLWKSWIDFEYEEEEYDRTRDLYERLLRRTSHVKVWVSFAQFEANAGLATATALAGGDEEEEEEGAEPKIVGEIDQAAVDEAKEMGLERARKVFQRGYDDLKNKSLKEEVSPSSCLALWIMY